MNSTHVAPKAMPPATSGQRPPRKPTERLFTRALLGMAFKQSLITLRPDIQWKNPVMFVVEIGAVLTFVFVIEIAFGIAHSVAPLTYFIALDAWLLLTVVFANFATAIAEERGKAQANALRRTRHDTVAYRLRGDGTLETVSSASLRRGDVVVVHAGEVIPGDGEVIEGTASVDESAITGESAPVIRDAGGDRSGVTGGTTVLSDEITVRVSADPGETFLDRMIALVEGAVRQRTPNEIALTLVLTAFTLIFLIVVVPLWPMAFNAEQYMTSYLGLAEPLHSLGTDVPTLVALLVCLIPTTIGALLAAIGIAGMDRALRANIIAKSGKSVEVAGDIDTVVLDKTGTITIGNRRATAFLPVGSADEAELKRLAALASFGDQTPEGKSIVSIVSPLAPYTPVHAGSGTEDEPKIIPFSAQSRMSGIDLPDGRVIRKGAPDAIVAWVRERGGEVPYGLDPILAQAGAQGATPLLVANGNEIAGVVLLADILKPGIRERIGHLRKMGLYTVMITGDNALTAATIAQLAGVNDFIAEATPEAKLVYLRKEQAEGKLVAMMGDGTNDAPALAQADVGLAMNSGTQAAKEAGNMVDLDSDPTKLIEVIEIGKQLLMTRGALTTFSIANDVAKYFAIVPALFAGTLPWLGAMDVMHLHSPTSAILSAVIFNALIIPLLIPVALKGVRYRALGADALLRRNLLIWGLGGVIVPFAGIKLIDVVMVALHLVA
ncbi:potassium-transporting ATPase subunit KdpB [Burkholderia vietnamiensis]|uniref:potassium-transporting ATPase subunit KdpB n=1 Tax=Burkholderia vietnamiensis TaxID=60552 RepID=UPI0015944747|nr:potassium-transporting ATPase subunit KdpB [Burkholderia vietnamiensis]MBR8165676.1 potassium-transporting ATPase subunit KdpB [Burkholderia vietnamiensis]UEC05356.1 potassium-transporting ATPase subunit KdpB [Burkholderia vietnamiensis]